MAAIAAPCEVVQGGEGPAALAGGQLEDAARTFLAVAVNRAVQVACRIHGERRCGSAFVVRRQVVEHRVRPSAVRRTQFEDCAAATGAVAGAAVEVSGGILNEPGLWQVSAVSCVVERIQCRLLPAVGGRRQFENCPLAVLATLVCGSNYVARAVENNALGRLAVIASLEGIGDAFRPAAARRDQLVN